jgi:hypothetical protein
MGFVNSRLVCRLARGTRCAITSHEDSRRRQESVPAPKICKDSSECLLDLLRVVTRRTSPVLYIPHFPRDFDKSSLSFEELIHSFILYSVWWQVYSCFPGEFSTECDLVLFIPVSIKIWQKWQTYTRFCSHLEVKLCITGYIYIYICIYCMVLKLGRFGQ